MRFAIYMFLLCLLAACSASSRKVRKPYVDQARYNSWMEDPSNGMITQMSSGDSIKWTCFYTTPEYEFLRSMHDADLDTRQTKDSLIAFRKEPKGDHTMYHFTVRIETPGGSLKKMLSTYPKLIEYVQSEMKADFQLAICGDTLEPVFYHFENTLDIMPAATAMISFEGKRRSDCDMTLLYTDKLLTYQTYRFSYPVYYLTRIPDPR